MQDSEEALSVIEFYRKRYMSLTAKDNFDRILWERLIVLSAAVNNTNKTSKVVFSIIIPNKFANHVQTVHGGAIATLFDGLTSSCLALISKPGFWNGAELTRSLEIKCFKPVPLEEPLNAECEIVHVGQRLASIRGVITKASDGSLLAACQHEKYNALPGGLAKL